MKINKETPDNINKLLYLAFSSIKIDIEGSRIYFKFNSTGYSFNFSIEAGFDIDGSYYKLKARSSDIFKEFEKIKLNL